MIFFTPFLFIVGVFAGATLEENHYLKTQECNSIKDLELRDECLLELE